MLLAADIGNSNITLGIFGNNKLLSTARIPTGSTEKELCDNLLSFLSENGVTADSAAIASVVPEASRPLTDCLKKTLSIEPFVISYRVDTGIAVKAVFPERVGTDRIVNACAAYHFYGGPVMVIDFGTATTYDVVDKEGGFLGGAIAPGVMKSAETLWEKTAKLPQVDISNPGKALGTDTVSSMRSGIYFGYLGQTEYLVRKLKEEAGFDMKTVATGGLSGIFRGNTDCIDVFDSDLTLNGINYIYSRNH